MRGNKHVQKERTPPPPDIALDPIEGLIDRARKLRRRGEPRSAIVLLRHACSLDEWRARTFTILGALLSEEGHREEAAKALTHARWLRQRAGEGSRAAVTARLLEEALSARR